MLKQIAKEQILLKQIREKCSKTSQVGISIIASTAKSKYIDNIFTNYTRLNYSNKELIIILNKNELNINDYKLRSISLNDIKIFQLDESSSLGECLNFGIEQSKYDYVSKMDDDDYYGANYILDLMNVFKYTDAKVTGKCSRFSYLEENNMLGICFPGMEYKYVFDVIAGGTITFKKEIFDKIKFKYLPYNGTDNYFLQDCKEANIKMFSADKFNYVYIKHINLDEHTWKITSKELMTHYCKEFMPVNNFVPLVTV